MEGTLIPAVFTKVNLLEPEDVHINLYVIVQSLTIVRNTPLLNGDRIRIAEVILCDDTASIILTARNEQLDTLTPGAHVLLRNAHIEMYDGHMRLVVDIWGVIEVAKDKFTFEIQKTLPNMSDLQYELVDSED